MDFQLASTHNFAYEVFMDIARLGPNLDIRRLQIQNIYELDLSSQQIPWMRTILDQYSNAETPPAIDGSTLTFVGTIQKKRSSEFGDYVLIEGELDCVYNTECVNTLETMSEKVEVDIKVCFIDPKQNQSEQGQDTEEIEITLDGEVWDLYFLEKDAIGFELLFLTNLELYRNPYPKLKPFEAKEQ